MEIIRDRYFDIVINYLDRREHGFKLSYFPLSEQQRSKFFFLTLYMYPIISQSATFLLPPTGVKICQ